MRRKDRQIEDPAAIMRILQEADVCRIAMCDRNVPYIVTMNFGLAKGRFASLYFHSASEGKKINILKKNNLVCFQADIEHELFLHSVSCGCSMKYQSVVGMGKISFVNELPEKLEALQAIMTHYTKKPEHVFKEELVKCTMIMRLDVEEISAKALVKPGHQQNVT
jgi:nitroimidazol reductase NimA-like FMN-containing flavoprotein (pyridoxamine 5'-phosphate oxidase superfamily)